MNCTSSTISTSTERKSSLKSMIWRVAQGLHEAVHELFGRQVKHAQIGLAGLQFMRDGVHQVGLAEADAAIQEQRVEADRAAFGHAAGGGMGQFVRLADDETVEGEARIQRGAGQLVLGRRGRGRGLGRRLGERLAQRARLGGLADGEFHAGRPARRRSASWVRIWSA